MPLRVSVKKVLKKTLLRHWSGDSPYPVAASVCRSWRLIPLMVPPSPSIPWLRRIKRARECFVKKPSSFFFLLIFSCFFFLSEVREVVIFIMNGFSFIESDAVKIRTDEIKRRGIEVMAVGATNRTGDEELEHLLSKPIKDHFFKLNGVDDSILSRICR